MKPNFDLIYFKISLAFFKINIKRYSVKNKFLCF